MTHSLLTILQFTQALSSGSLAYRG